MSFAVAGATLTNQEVSAQHPVLSALLPGDARIQIVVPPVVPPRTVSVTIRRPGADERTLDTCCRDGLFERTVWQWPAALAESMSSVSPLERELVGALDQRNFVAFFELAVRRRLNLLIVGATGSGKTSFMKTLCRHIPAGERGG